MAQLAMDDNDVSAKIDEMVTRLVASKDNIGSLALLIISKDRQLDEIEVCGNLEDLAELAAHLIQATVTENEARFASAH